MRTNKWIFTDNRKYIYAIEEVSTDLKQIAIFYSSVGVCLGDIQFFPTTE